MAAVTLAGTVSVVDAGSILLKTFPSVTIATTGDTLSTGLQNIVNAFSSNSAAITSMTFSSGTVTFNTTGAVSAAAVTVMGY